MEMLLFGPASRGVVEWSRYPAIGVGLEQCCEMGWRWRGVGDGEVWLIEMFCFRSASRSVVGWSRYPAIGVGWSNAERWVGDGQVW